MQHVLILRCMYVPMSVTLGPWDVPSPIYSPTACGRIRELQRCSISSISTKASFMKKLLDILKMALHADFELLDSRGKSSYMQGSELKRNL